MSSKTNAKHEHFGSLYYEYLHHWLVGESSTLTDVIRDFSKASEPSSAKMRCVHNFIHIYRTLRRVFGCNEVDPDGLRDLLVRWLSWEERDALSPALKWYFAALFSDMTGQDKPPCPRGPYGPTGGQEDLKLSYVLTGKLTRFLRSVAYNIRLKVVGPKGRPRSHPGRSALRKAQILLNLKKGCARVSDSMLQSAMDAQRASLTRDRPMVLDGEQYDRLLATVRSVVREVFSRPSSRRPICRKRDCPCEGLTSSHADLYSDRYRDPIPFTFSQASPFPSSRGHYSMKANVGGAAAKVLDLWARAKSAVPSDRKSSRVLLSALGHTVGEADAAEIHSSFADLVDEEIKKESVHFYAKPMSIPEPLKVRVVTMGPEFSYWALKDLQRYLWRCVKDHPTFPLIAATVTEEHVRDLAQALKPGGFFVSGDFKNATNELCSELSNLLMREIADYVGLSPELGEMALRALTGHTLVYKPVDQELRLARYFDLGTGLFVKDGCVTSLFKRWHKTGSRTESGDLRKGCEFVYPSPWAFLEERGIRFGHPLLQGYRPKHRACEPYMGFAGAMPFWPELWHIEEQKNGQLMGSPVSFPILCLANAVLSRMVLDEGDEAGAIHALASELSEGRGDWAQWAELQSNCIDRLRRPLHSLPIRINGDDVVFTSTKDQYESWLRYGKALGLESSVGKTYISPNWLQINSQVFRLTQRKEFEIVPYLNLGLLSPFDPKGGSPRCWQMLFALLRDFLKGYDAHGSKEAFSRDYLIRWFLNDHKSLLKTVPDGASYWLPRHLGGVGLAHVGKLRMSTKQKRTSITARQLELADYLRKNRTEILSFPSIRDPTCEWFTQGTKVLNAHRIMVPQQDEEFPWDYLKDPTSTAPYWGHARKGDFADPKNPLRLKGNFKKLWKKSKGNGFATKASKKGARKPNIGLYLQEPDHVAVLRYGSGQYLDDRYLLPKGLFRRFSINQPVVHRVGVFNNYEMRVREYGLLLPHLPTPEKLPQCTVCGAGGDYCLLFCDCVTGESESADASTTLGTLP